MKVRYYLFTFLLLSLIFSLVFFVSPFKTLAAETDVVINEVLPDPSGSENDEEFIELYNKGTEAVVISDWNLSDKSGKVFMITETTINPGEFIVFKSAVTKISLNNSGGDDVILKNTNGTVIDQMSYDNALEDRSWSRIPDGTGGFSNNTPPTEKSANISPPTSTPEPTATPTKTLTPTKTPTPTKEPSPTKTPKPTQPDPTESEDQEEELEDEEDVLGESSDNEIQLLTSEDSSDSEKEEEKEEKAEVLGAKKSAKPKIMVGLGSILLASVCGILCYQTYKKHKEGEL